MLAHLIGEEIEVETEENCETNFSLYLLPTKESIEWDELHHGNRAESGVRVILAE